MSLHPEQADEHPSTHIIMSCSQSYRCISQYQEMIEEHGQSFIGFNLPPQRSQPQSPACKVVPCHCWTCGNSLLYTLVATCWGGWPFPRSLLDALISDGVKVVTLLPFPYSSAAMTWCFDGVTILDTSAFHGMSYSLLQVSIQLLSRSQITWM